MARGEDGKGIASRWYPSTLIGRINLIGHYEQQFSVLNGTGLSGWLAYLKGIGGPPLSTRRISMLGHNCIDMETVTSRVFFRYWEIFRSRSP
jgi:hypothetical protein